jgi:translation initiation factor 2 beta subunit (eIF-2beta)/eIF-5
MIDESIADDSLDTITQRILNGRHKLISKPNALKYAEDFYASINNQKIKELFGDEFSSLGGQWLQVDGIDNQETTYAWLVLSPWGKLWISRLAILCFALSTTDNFTTSDIDDQSLISFKERPHPMQISASTRQRFTQGDLTIKDNHTTMSNYNPTKKFKNDSADISTQQTFSYLYGLEKFAAVRGDSLWDPEMIGKTLGKTAITGLATLALGGGYYGFGTSGIGQLYERQQYLNATIPNKVKQQSQDLYDEALLIAGIVQRMNNPEMTFIATKLREVVDDFRQTIPDRFNGKDINTKSFYSGTPDEIRQRYRGVFAQSTKNTTVNSNSTKEEMLGIAKEEKADIVNENRLPESLVAGGIAMTKSSPANPKSWLIGAVPMLSHHLEGHLEKHMSSPTLALEGKIKSMQEILGEIRVLAREHDSNNKTNMYEEVKNATNVVYSFLTKLSGKMTKSEKTDNHAIDNNINAIPGNHKVYE